MQGEGEGKGTVQGEGEGTMQGEGEGTVQGEGEGSVQGEDEGTVIMQAKKKILKSLLLLLLETFSRFFFRHMLSVLVLDFLKIFIKEKY